MTDYTSPIPRRSMYSSPSNRSFNTLPLPESAFRDTTINEATAFSNAEQQHKQQPYSYTTRSPSRSLSGVGAGSHIDNTYLMSPSKRFSMARRETDQYGLVDSDNEFIEFKPMEYLGRQPSSFSQRSSSDDDDDPYQEEEFLAFHPGEEELRRSRITGRRFTADGSQVGSFHSLYSRNSLDAQDMVENNDSVPSHQSSPTPSSSPPIILALERIFKGAMLCIFMVFWLVRKMTVTFITFVLVIVVKIFINPLVYLLQIIGFRSLTFPTPLTLSARDSPSSSFHWIWSVLLLAIPSLWYLQRTYPDIHHSIWPLSLPVYQLPHWATPTTAMPRDGDSVTMHRVVELEKTVNGLVEHMQKQDTNSKQQFSSINWYLDQLQTQLTQWTASQSKALEKSLEGQMDKVEKVLASTTTEWNDRYLKPRTQDGSTVVSPELVDALRQTFVPKSDLDDNAMRWDDLVKHHQGSLDQYIQGMMDQYIQEQRRLGKWMDMDTLMTQMVQPGGMTTEASNLVRGWIDTAIQRYYQDLTGTPDYALSTRGAMIIHALTSPTFSSLDNTHQHWWAKWYAEWTQPTISPVIALTPGTQAGQCWPMKGNHGSLGIKLSEPINVQGITVEYPSQPPTGNKISSAPKRLDIWGIQDLNAGFSMDEYDSDSHGNSIYLGTLNYDLLSQPTQTFPITTNRYILFEAVVVRVLSNWGHPQYTCLCRVGVHGTTAV